MKPNLILSSPNFVTIEISEQQIDYAYYYVCFNLCLLSYFLSVYCNVMLAMIKKGREDED